MPFKKGQSGNPTGRPKALETVTKAAKAHTEGCLRTLVSIRDNADNTPASRVAACTALLDRAWGRPAQAISMTGSGMNISFVLQHGPQIIEASARQPMLIAGLDEK